MNNDIKGQHIQDIDPKLLKLFLSDKTTKKYLRWGSDNYIGYGEEYGADQEMSPELVIRSYEFIIQPRVIKTEEEKANRTKDRAEVFTPSWVCNEQNNLIDNAWLGYANAFNHSEGKTWITVTDKIRFSDGKKWKDYVDARRLEVTCGEAPYLVSRYDTVSGDKIAVKDRIGLLDRKLRVIKENAADEEEWYQWTVRAFQSCYGYDFQGDNVFLARENLLFTFIEYFQEYMNQDPNFKQINEIANIIAWNIWQMNGITMTAPFSQAEAAYKQISLFELYGDGKAEEDATINEIPCKIFDWRAKRSMEFGSIVRGK